METLSTALLWITASGAFGAVIAGIVARTSHKLRIPFFGTLIEIGFLGDALIGAAASVAVFLVAAPLLNISLEGGQAQEHWIKITSLGVVSGFIAIKLLASSSPYFAERMAVLNDRLECVEKAEKASGLVRQADALAADHRFEHAIASYDEALRINPRDESALIGKAEVYAERGQWGKAVNIASRVLAFDPSSKRGHYDRARYKNMAATYPKEEVLQDLRSAISLDPNYKDFARLQDPFFETLRQDEGFCVIVG
jgi:tetratricopeptide (TPR) repeat protein